MKWFLNLKIRNKLILAFISVASIALAIGYIGIRNINAINDNDTQLYENMTVPLTYMGEISTYFQRVRVNTREILLANNQKEITIYIEKIKSYRDSIKTLDSKFEERILSSEMRTLWTEFKNSRVEFGKDLDKLFEIVEAGKKDEAFAFVKNQLDKSAFTEMKLIDEIVTKKTLDAQKKSDDNTLDANKATTLLIIFIIVGIITSVGLGLFISNLISKPINALVDIAGKVSKGDVDVNVVQTSTDEIGALMGAFKQMIENIKHQVAVAEKISVGDLSVEVVVQSDKDVLNKSFVMVVDTLKGLVSEADLLSKAAVDGKLAVRGNSDAFKGSYKEIINGVNATLDAVIGPLNVAAEYVDRIAKGNIPSKITDNYNGDFNEIKLNLNMCIDAVNALVSDANMLADAAVEGRLSVRASADKHQGDFKKIIQGVNNTLDSVIGPLNIAAEYVDRIAKGDIPSKITDNYNGDFNEIKLNLNTCIDAVNALINDANTLSAAALEGRLSTRADVTKHFGDFRKIVQGVNDTLDAVIGPLNVAAEYVDKIAKGNIPAKITENYNGDFNGIKNNLNTCIDAVNALIADTDYLSKSAVEGRLGSRADANKHHGDFGKIVQGINDTLDAVIGPLNVAAEYVDRIAKGDIPEKITDHYNGDFNEIKNNLNTCIDAINLLIEDSYMLSAAAIDGKLSVRANEEKHNGDFKRIISGVNSTLDAVVNPLKIASDYIENLSKRNLAVTIKEEFKGDFNELKNNLNQTIESIQLLIEDANMLATSALDGNLSQRADLKRHTGEYKKIIGGFNDTLDTVLAPIREG